jgi:hypothetical protein
MSGIRITRPDQGLSLERRALWDRLWMVSDKRSGPVHPLLYRHPETGRPVLCFHLGMTERFIMDYGQPQARQVDEKETLAILDQIQAGLWRIRCICICIYYPG